MYTFFNFCIDNESEGEGNPVNRPFSYPRYWTGTRLQVRPKQGVFWNANDIYLFQKSITRSQQLPHIPVTAFSQTDLFLVWIYLEFRFPQEPQWPLAIISADQCWHVDMMSTISLEAASLPKRAHVDWNWPISREKYLKIDWSVKMPLHWLIMGVAVP